MNEQTTLRSVERAAARAAASRSALDVEIRRARESGASLRAIAKAANVSHEEIRRRLEPRA